MAAKIKVLKTPPKEVITLAQIQAFIEMSKMDINVNLPKDQWLHILELAAKQKSQD